MCRNSIWSYPGGGGNARSFARIVSESMIYLWMWAMAFISPFFDRGRSYSSSLSPSSSALLVDRRYRFKAKA